MPEQPQSPAQVTQLIQSEINRELLSSHLHAFNARARKLKINIKKAKITTSQQQLKSNNNTKLLDFSVLSSHH